VTSFLRTEKSQFPFENWRLCLSRSEAHHYYIIYVFLRAPQVAPVAVPAAAAAANSDAAAATR
jgi:hypothetical protein